MPEDMLIETWYAVMHRLLTGEQLRPFVPQTTHLALITTGDTYAVATKGWLCFEASPHLHNNIHALFFSLSGQHCVVSDCSHSVSPKDQFQAMTMAAFEMTQYRAVFCLSSCLES